MRRLITSVIVPIRFVCKSAIVYQWLGKIRIVVVLVKLWQAVITVPKLGPQTVFVRRHLLINDLTVEVFGRERKYRGVRHNMRRASEDLRAHCFTDVMDRSEAATEGAIVVDVWVVGGG